MKTEYYYLSVRVYKSFYLLLLNMEDENASGLAQAGTYYVSYYIPS